MPSETAAEIESFPHVGQSSTVGWALRARTYGLPWGQIQKNPDIVIRHVATLTFLGAARTVTGSKYLLEHNGRRVLFDCGLFQGLKELRLRNWDEFPVPPASLDAVVLTHAHLDHVGYLPRLTAQGYKGRVFCTPGTKDLCQLVLPDAGRIQEEDARQANKHGYSKHQPALPLFGESDALRALTHLQPLGYRAADRGGSGHLSRVSSPPVICWARRS